MKLLELKGLKSLRALNTFHRLMLGIKMLPSYMLEDYDAFYARVEKMPTVDQRRVLTEAARMVDLSPEEFEALACFATDDNGVPFDSNSLKNLKPDKLVEIIVEVGMLFMKINLDFTTPDEKKK